MIYKVTLPNGETLHTGYGPLADVWLNRHGGKLERISLSSIAQPSREMWDGSALSSALISVDRLRALLGDAPERENSLWKEVAAWRMAFVRINGLAYDPERDTIVHIDTGHEYLPAREYKTPSAPDVRVPEGQEPIPTMLHCPTCQKQHVDEGEWATRPHKTHQCQHCGHEWRPFEYPTVGIPAADERVQDHHIGFSMFLTREEWGAVFDGLMLEEQRTSSRVAANSESTGSMRRAMCIDLLKRVGARCSSNADAALTARKADGNGGGV